MWFSLNRIQHSSTHREVYTMRNAIARRLRRLEELEFQHRAEPGSSLVAILLERRRKRAIADGREPEPDPPKVTIGREPPAPPENWKRRGIQVLRGCSAARDEFLEHAPLLVPVDPADDGPQVSLVEALEVRKEKDLLLNIRRKIQQFHDLGHTGSRHAGRVGRARHNLETLRRATVCQTGWRAP